MDSLKKDLLSKQLINGSGIVPESFYLGSIDSVLNCSSPYIPQSLGAVPQMFGIPYNPLRL